MKKNFKKSLSVLLAVLMAVSCFSVAGFAAETTYPGHENHLLRIEPAVTAQGCTDGKTEAVYCDACPNKPLLKASTVVKAPHNLGDWEIPAGVTDCEKGYTVTKTCKDCKVIIETQVVNTHEWVLKDKETAKYCTETSYENKECKICKMQVREPIEGGLHSWGNDAEAAWVTVEKATCTLDGKQIRDCDNCIFVDERVISAAGHKYEIADAGKEPTCEKEGSTVRWACKNCGDVIPGDTLGKLGHSDTDGDSYCDNCDTYIAENGEVCNCPCHLKSGLLRILYRIVLFFLQLFNVGQKCVCGADHYAAR